MALATDNSGLSSLKRKLRGAAKEIQAINEKGKLASKNPSEIPAFMGMFRALGRYFDKFETLWEEINDIYDSLGKSQEFQASQEYQIMAVVQKHFYDSNTYYETLSKAQEMDRLNFTFSEPKQSQNLPRINLPKFDGELMNWTKFRDVFMSLVHQEGSLTPTQKFHYLISSLTGPALSVIKHLNIQDSNYELAWKCLLGTYDNKRMLASSYLNNILDFKPRYDKNRSVDGLKAFLCQISDSVSAFKLLNLPDESSFILFHLAMKGVDPHIREQFEIAHKDKQFPTFEDLDAFIRERCLALQFAESTSLKHSSSTNNSNNNSHSFRNNDSKPAAKKPSYGSSKSKTTLIASNQPQEKTNNNSTSQLKCIICQAGPHALLSCKMFFDASTNQRLEWLKNWKGCQNCLSYHHSTRDCKSKWHCRFCKTRHHSLLHVNENIANVSVLYTEHALHTNDSSQQEPIVLLGTARGFIKDARQMYQPLRIVVDSGSQYSFISLKCSNRLGLHIQKCHTRISGIGQSVLENAKGKVVCTIRPQQSQGPVLETQAIVIKRITSCLPNTLLSPHLKDMYTGYELADPEFSMPRPVDFLLGADLFPDIWTGPVIGINNNIPKLFPSIFGHIVMGRLCQSNIPKATSLFTLSHEESINEAIKRFWELEEVPAERSHPLNSEEQHCEEHFVQTHQRDKEGRYIVSLPFREEPHCFLDAEEVCKHRLRRIEMKLQQKPTLQVQYQDFMKEYELLGHMQETEKPSKCIIPHHCVVKEEKKLRVVFDASAKFKMGSLNDLLMTGPKLQKDIKNILLNFRAHKFVMVADVVKMYRNILLSEEHRPFQHILWRHKFDDAIKRYELNTLTYGLSCSPFLALRVVAQLIEDEGIRYPQAARILSRDIYIDDIITGADTLDALFTLKEEVVSLLKRGCFELGKWGSNSPEFMKKLNLCQQTEPMDLVMNGDQTIKILGLYWDSQSDCFLYKINYKTQKVTKRAILSTLARIYDPLGYLAPIVIVMKIFVQELWKKGFGWDEDIPKDLEEKWSSITSQLHLLSQIQIPRYLSLIKCQQAKIVGFCDASMDAYCAVLYLQIIHEQEISSKLLLAKTKVAPTKTLSIPRLELCGALLLTRLYLTTLEFQALIPHQLEAPSFYTDSTIVLGWLNLPSYRLKTFVAHRVAEITSAIPFSQWKYVPSLENPADIGSRGSLPSSLVQSDLWWNGPHWLLQSEDSLPTRDPPVVPALPELKSETCLTTTISENWMVTWSEKFSSYLKFIRCISWLYRFAHNMRNPDSRRKGPLHLSEIQMAKSVCCRAIQAYYFFKNQTATPKSVESLHHLKNLCPFIDERGLLRVGGRLQQSNLPPAQKHPILLPKESHFTNLMISYFHQTYLHPGPLLLQALIQTQFWVPSLRRLVRKCTFQCIKCYRSRPKLFQPIMGNLPSYRVNGGRAFLHTGLDFAGPFNYKELSRRKAPTYKLYVCIFICMVTKSIHLESVSNLSTDSFLASLKRFTARRGWPSDLYSDCGTNFKGASNHIMGLTTWYNSQDTTESILNFLSRFEVKWHFNPPQAPHFGGLWEAGVNSFKRIFKLTVGETVLTLEEFNTLLAQCECILNSRPLCPLSPSPEENNYLSPGHFLIGDALTALPEPSLLDLKENTLSRWQLVQRMSQHIWKRWRLTYLTNLQNRTKWLKSSDNPKVGDLVLLKDDYTPALQWPLARITKIFQGKDGVARVAEIKTNKGIYKRPLVKLAPLLPVSIDPESQ